MPATNFRQVLVKHGTPCISQRLSLKLNIQANYALIPEIKKLEPHPFKVVSQAALGLSQLKKLDRFIEKASASAAVNILRFQQRQRA